LLVLNDSTGDANKRAYTIWRQPRNPVDSDAADKASHNSLGWDKAITANDYCVSQRAERSRSPLGA
jgi:hypothetical protein